MARRPVAAIAYTRGDGTVAFVRLYCDDGTTWDHRDNKFEQRETLPGSEAAIEAHGQQHLEAMRAAGIEGPRKAITEPEER